MRVANVPMQGWLATPTRRNALKGILIAPSFMMLGLAMQPSPSFMDYDDMISSKEVDARITNYVGVVGEAEKALDSLPPDRLAVRKVATMWASQAEQGLLRPLPAQGTEDTFVNGVKGQILRSARGLSSALGKSAGAAIKEKQFNLAAQELALGIKVLQPLRYSDATATSVVGSIQKRLLNQLQDCWPHLSKNAQAEARPVIAMVQGSPAELARVIRDEHRLAAIAFAQDSEMALARGERPSPQPSYLKSADLVSATARRAEASSSKATDFF